MEYTREIKKRNRLKYVKPQGRLKDTVLNKRTLA